LIELHPVKVSEVFPSLPGFMEIGFDFVETAQAFHCPLHFIRALTSLIRQDGWSKEHIENEYVMSILWELSLSGQECVRIAVEQLQKEIGLEVSPSH
jgi:hypothetical protein